MKQFRRIEPQGGKAGPGGSMGRWDAINLTWARASGQCRLDVVLGAKVQGAPPQTSLPTLFRNPQPGESSLCCTCSGTLPQNSPRCCLLINHLSTLWVTYWYCDSGNRPPLTTLASEFLWCKIGHLINKHSQNGDRIKWDMEAVRP